MGNLSGVDTTLNEMYLSQALHNRTIHFVEEFERESCYKAIYLMERIERLDDEENLPVEKRVINIVWASYGGSAYGCLALISVIERLKEKGYTINSHVQSMAMSAGFFTSIVCTHRTIARHAYLMCHQLSSGAFGTLQSMENEIEHSKDLNDRMLKITEKYTNITMKELLDMKNSNKDWFMNAEEALSLGCVDEII